MKVGRGESEHRTREERIQESKEGISDGNVTQSSKKFGIFEQLAKETDRVEEKDSARNDTEAKRAERKKEPIEVSSTKSKAKTSIFSEGEDVESSSLGGSQLYSKTEQSKVSEETPKVAARDNRISQIQAELGRKINKVLAEFEVQHTLDTAFDKYMNDKLNTWVKANGHDKEDTAVDYWKETAANYWEDFCKAQGTTTDKIGAVLKGQFEEYQLDSLATVLKQSTDPYRQQSGVALSENKDFRKFIIDRFHNEAKSHNVGELYGLASWNMVNLSRRFLAEKYRDMSSEAGNRIPDVQKIESTLKTLNTLQLTPAGRAVVNAANTKMQNMRGLYQKTQTVQNEITNKLSNVLKVDGNSKSEDYDLYKKFEDNAEVYMKCKRMLNNLESDIKNNKWKDKNYRPVGVFDSKEVVVDSPKAARELGKKVMQHMEQLKKDGYIIKKTFEQHKAADYLGLIELGAQRRGLSEKLQTNVKDAVSTLRAIGDSNLAVSNANQVVNNANRAMSNANQVMSNVNQIVNNANQMVNNANRMVNNVNQVMSNANGVTIVNQVKSGKPNTVQKVSGRRSSGWEL